MSGFALLWGKILESSLWVTESKETRLVWITLLAMKDAEGVIQASVVGLADRAKVKESECREALRVLLSPDPGDTSKVEGGRRIREVPGGWQIVNNEAYRFSTEARRAIWREQKAAQRAAEWVGKEKLAGMNAAERAAYEAGRARGYGKRRKPVGTRAAATGGEMAGAQAAISEGMAERMPVMGNPTSQVARGTSPESGEVGKKAMSAGIPAEITSEAAAKMRAYVEEQARLTKAREAAQQRPAATVARPVPAVAIVGPVGMPKPIGSPLGVGWVTQDVEIGKPSAPGPVAAGAQVKPAGPVPISAAIDQPVKAAGQG